MKAIKSVSANIDWLTVSQQNPDFQSFNKLSCYIGNLSSERVGLKRDHEVSILPTARSWLGKGCYVQEYPGLGALHKSSIVIQDVKVVSMFMANKGKLELLFEGFWSSDASLQKMVSDTSIDQKYVMSQMRIDDKSANFNCWQFCLIVYAQTGILNWETIGQVYDLIEQTYSYKMPQAMMCGKFSSIDFQKDENTPSPGDIVCFSRDQKGVYHAAIFQSVDLENRTYSVIEIIEDKVQTRTISFEDMEYETFVRSQDIEENLQNFITTHSS